jgi:hypothetical protein
MTINNRKNKLNITLNFMTPIAKVSFFAGKGIFSCIAMLRDVELGVLLWVW